MNIDEKVGTGLSVPEGEYEKPGVVESSEKNDTSEESRSIERTLILAISEGVEVGCTFNIDIERDEEKRFFSKLNKELKNAR